MRNVMKHRLLFNYRNSHTWQVAASVLRRHCPGLTQLIVQMLDDQIFAGAPEDVTDSAWQLLIEVLCEVRTASRIWRFVLTWCCGEGSDF